MHASRTRLLKTIITHVCLSQKVHTYFFATRLMNLGTFLNPPRKKPSDVVCQVSKCADKSIIFVYIDWNKKWSFLGEVGTHASERHKINCMGKHFILMCDVLPDLTLTFTVKCVVNIWIKKVHVVPMTKNIQLYLYPNPLIFHQILSFKL